MRKIGWSSLALGAVLACPEPSGPRFDEIVLTPDREVYAPGDLITADLFNGSDIEIGFGGCDLRLEQRVGSQWQIVGPAHLPCLSILYGLTPGGRTTQTLRLATDLEPGDYRLRQRILPRTSLPARYVWSDVVRVGAAAP